MTNHETVARDALMQAHVALAVQAGRDQAALARLHAVVARIAQMTDHWERQLPEVIRTPAVVSAIRAALEPAVSVPPPAPRADAEAVARVRALHQPAECVNVRCKLKQWCIGCDPDGIEGCDENPWPCPTIRALDGEQQPVGPCVAGEQQNETPEAEAPVVAYRSRDSRSLYCTAHAGELFGLSYEPVTAEDLPDGGICMYPDCGRDVLAGPRP